MRKTVKDESKSVDAMVVALVKEHTKQLDDDINEIKSLLSNDSWQLSDDDLEKMMLRIPVLMYTAAQGVETLGIQADLSKSAKEEVFNKRVEEVQGTIRDKESAAKLASFNEQLIEIVFTRAYKQISNKLRLADNVYTAVKKVIDKRTKEIDISRRDRN